MLVCSSSKGNGLDILMGSSGRVHEPLSFTKLSELKEDKARRKIIALTHIKNQVAQDLHKIIMDTKKNPNHWRNGKMLSKCSNGQWHLKHPHMLVFCSDLSEGGETCISYTRQACIETNTKWHQTHNGNPIKKVPRNPRELRPWFSLLGLLKLPIITSETCKSLPIKPSHAHAK